MYIAMHPQRSPYPKASSSEYIGVRPCVVAGALSLGMRCPSKGPSALFRSPTLASFSFAWPLARYKSIYTKSHDLSGLFSLPEAQCWLLRNEEVFYIGDGDQVEELFCSQYLKVYTLQPQTTSASSVIQAIISRRRSRKSRRPRTLHSPCWDLPGNNFKLQWPIIPMTHSW